MHRESLCSLDVDVVEGHPCLNASIYHKLVGHGVVAHWREYELSEPSVAGSAYHTHREDVRPRKSIVFIYPTVHHQRVGIARGTLAHRGLTWGNRQRDTQRITVNDHMLLVEQLHPYPAAYRHLNPLAQRGQRRRANLRREVEPLDGYGIEIDTHYRHRTHFQLGRHR